MTTRIGKFIIGSICFSAAFLLAVSPTLADEVRRFTVGLGFDYATGDYGTDTDTDSIRVPLSISYYPTERLDFEVVVPFLYQDNSNTLASGGMRFPFEDRMGGRRASFDTTDSVSGLGDISLTAGYILRSEDDSLPSVRPLLYLKLPTADEDEGLGTGELDIGAGVGAAKWFGSLYTFAEGRYIFQGSSSDFGLEDYATLTAEAGYLVSETFLPTASLWWSSAPSEESDELLEARINGNWWLSGDTSFQGYLGKGLSSDAADFSAGLTVYYGF